MKLGLDSTNALNPSYGGLEQILCFLTLSVYS
jgi:hypothetical protein